DSVIGEGTLDGGGVATFTTSDLTTGLHSITAEYQGDDSFVGNVSPGVEQEVEKDGVTVMLISSPNPSVVGDSVMLTATVRTASTGGVPTGEVVFFDGETE